MNIDRLEGEQVISSIFELSTTESSLEENTTIKLKLFFDKFIDENKERYMFCLYCPKEHLNYRIVERGQLDFDSFSRNEAIELWKSMGAIIKEELK